MKLFGLLVLLQIFVEVGGQSKLSAEPWLNNRYAQNCAGCHAPGRKNLPHMDRRCSLSCQGCHVNPNGGGLRSFYGKWNSERWLRSFKTPGSDRTKLTAPVTKQAYYKTRFETAKFEEKEKGIRYGANLVTLKGDVVNEEIYDRRDKFYHETADTWNEFMYQVPQGDPIREMEATTVDAGGDVRWIWAKNLELSLPNGQKSPQEGKEMSFLMAGDFGLRWRPIHKNLHLVYESRIFGSPSKKTRHDQVNSAGTRSLYLMIDDLPFNTFVMSGMYLPLINSASPDHTFLTQQMLATALYGSAVSHKMVFKATSIGTAPNVPFANFHYIHGKEQIGEDGNGDSTQGYAVNLGLRFVTLGGAVNYTYWKTQETDAETDNKTDVLIHSFGISGQLWRVTAGLETVSLSKDSEGADFRQGGVTSLKTRTQLWREVYFLAHYASANRTTALLPGYATQSKFGFRAFWLNGIESMWTYETKTETTNEETSPTGYGDTTVSSVVGQLHLYF